MTHSLIKRAALPCLAMAALMATGCASVAVSNDQMRGKPRPSQLAAQQLGGEAA